MDSLSAIFALFFPYRCLLCMRRIQNTPICFRCRPEPHLNAIFCGAYEGNLKRLIKVAKYRPSRILMSELCEYFSLLFIHSSQDWDLIVPIPPTLASYKKRLFHQTYLLAKAAQKSIRNKPPIMEILRPQRAHKQQALLKLKERIHNMHAAFYVTESISGKKILLIDDVITTGATTGAAKRALLDAGALSVDVYCLARSKNFERFKGRIYEAFGV